MKAIAFFLIVCETPSDRVGLSDCTLHCRFEGCNLQSDNCLLLHNGRLTKPQNSEGVAVVTVVTCAPSVGRGPFIAIACSQLCPDVNHPVCAVDAQGLPKTFANRCFVDFAYCREGKYYVIMKDGEC